MPVCGTLYTSKDVAKLTGWPASKASLKLVKILNGLDRAFDEQRWGSRPRNAVTGFLAFLDAAQRLRAGDPVRFEKMLLERIDRRTA